MIVAFEHDGIDAMLDEYRELQVQQPAGAFQPSLLDSLGWRIVRGGDAEAGMKLFELNFTEHPDSFSAHESLAYALSMSGQKARGLALAQAWLEKNPEHGTGLQLLDELRGKHDR